jgi:YVTN family beta-propeller protein
LRAALAPDPIATKELNPMTRLLPIFVFALLLGASTAQANHTKIYVANQGSNTVTVIDDQRVSAMASAQADGTPAADQAAVATQDFAIVTTIPVGLNPIAVGISADGSLAYVANLNSNTLSVIDTDIDTVVATVNAGPTPRDVEATPDGRYILVVNQSMNQVTVLDASNYSIVKTVAVGNFPCAIAIAPDGSAAYVTNRLSNDVSIIDLTTIDLPTVAVTNVPVGTFACDVMVSANSQWAIVTNRLSGNVTIIDAASKTAVATVATGTNPQGVVFSPDGAKAYVTNAATTSVIDMASLTVVETIANIASGTCAVGATMDMNYGHNGHVYVASNTQAGRVTVIDVGTNSVIGVFSVGVRMWPTRM